MVCLRNINVNTLHKKIPRMMMMITIILLLLLLLLLIIIIIILIIKELPTTVILDTAHIIRKVLMYKYKTHFTYEITLDVHRM
jgi:hypothetical protein